MTDPAPVRRSAVDFSDPEFSRCAMIMGGAAMCSYMLAMAAWQRGLSVEYFGSQSDVGADVPVLRRTASVPRLLAVSDGSERHFFDSSMGDLTSLRVAEMATSKAMTNARLREAGVATPRGLVSDASNLSQIRDFLAGSKSEYFVVKPVVGTQGIGVVTQLTKAQVMPLLTQRGASLNIVEEFVRGTEYRCYVVGDQAVDAYRRDGIFVVGNGYDSIGKLIIRKNARREADPGLKKALIDMGEATIYLRGFGKEPAMVPVMGQRVMLSNVLNISVGGDSIGLGGVIPADVAQAAIAASLAIGLPNCGVDLIHDGQRPYVLEVNARAHLGGHAFVSGGTSCGNVIGEAIIDHYFPARDGQTIQRRNLPLDCTAVVAEFAANGPHSRHVLPALPAPDV